MRREKFTRTCRACNFKKDKRKDLIQIGYDKKENEIIIAEKENIENVGKTMYICRNIDCINISLKKRSIQKNFKIKEIDEEKVRKSLEAIIGK